MITTRIVDECTGLVASCSGEETDLTVHAGLPSSAGSSVKVTELVSGCPAESKVTARALDFHIRTVRKYREKYGDRGRPAVSKEKPRT